jgi:GTP-binding protein
VPAPPALAFLSDVGAMTADYFDQATIFLQAGTGGDGMATMRREKFVPRGGPDGGDGGRGGHIYLEADPSLNTLLQFREKHRYEAGPGKNGGTARKHGSDGRDVVIRVPLGTQAKVTIEGKTYVIDLIAPQQRLLAARGGKGGLGNVHFTTSVHQAPRIAELGEPGQKITLELELKLLADVGLVGFPNAGKSSLIAALSSARPKIASYPFTTLMPNLGVVGYGDDSFVIADIPGLVEGAHRGVGLGHSFLRHIERTRVLIHVIDMAAVDQRDPWEDYVRINEELVQYRPELAQRPQIIALNKSDLPDSEVFIDAYLARFRAEKRPVFVISAGARTGLEPLLKGVVQLLQDQPRLIDSQPREEVLQWPVDELNERVFYVEAERNGFRVRGRRIERLVSMTNFAQSESLGRLQRVLEATGITAELLRQGIEVGQTVYIEKAALTWTEDYVP